MIAATGPAAELIAARGGEPGICRLAAAMIVFRKAAVMINMLYAQALGPSPIAVGKGAVAFESIYLIRTIHKRELR